jgi:hypothetical protein
VYVCLGFKTSTRELGTPCCLHAEGKEDLTVLAILMTPCFKLHLLIHGRDSGGFTIHKFDKKQDEHFLPDYRLDLKSDILVEHVKEALTRFITKEGPYGPVTESNPISWQYDPSRNQDISTRFPTAMSVAEEEPTRVQPKQHFELTINNCLHTFTAGNFLKEHRLQLKLTYFDNTSDTRSDKTKSLKAGSFVTVKNHLAQASRFVFLGVFALDGGPRTKKSCKIIIYDSFLDRIGSCFFSYINQTDAEVSDEVVLTKMRKQLLDLSTAMHGKDKFIDLPNLTNASSTVSKSPPQSRRPAAVRRNAASAAGNKRKTRNGRVAQQPKKRKPAAKVAKHLADNQSSGSDMDCSDISSLSEDSLTSVSVGRASHHSSGSSVFRGGNEECGSSRGEGRRRRAGDCGGGGGGDSYATPGRGSSVHGGNSHCSGRASRSSGRRGNSNHVDYHGEEWASGQQAEVGRRRQRDRWGSGGGSDGGESDGGGVSYGGDRGGRDSSFATPGGHGRASHHSPGSSSVFRGGNEECGSSRGEGRRRRAGDCGGGSGGDSYATPGRGSSVHGGNSHCSGRASRSSGRRGNSHHVDYHGEEWASGQQLRRHGRGGGSGSDVDDRGGGDGSFATPGSVQGWGSAYSGGQVSHSSGGSYDARSWEHKMEVTKKNCELVMMRKLARDAEERARIISDQMYINEMNCCF